MEKKRSAALAWMAAGSLVVLAACGQGGSGGATLSPQTSEPVSTTSAISNVPLAGELVADCGDNGIGVIDSAIDTVNVLDGGALPADLPTLSDVIALADLPGVPVIGGLMDDGSGSFTPLDVDTVLGMLPAGVPGLGSLPLPGQLPTVCSSVTGSLPAGSLTDPALLLLALGDPTAALGVIPLFDASGDPVGGLLATIPAGLNPAGGSGVSLPGVPELPELGTLTGLDPSSLPVVGPGLGSIAGDLLGLLDVNGLLDGGLLALLQSLLGGIV